MKIKSLLFLLPSVLLMSCGGEEEGTESEGSEGTETTEETAEYHTSFGTCNASGSIISMTSGEVPEDYASSMDALTGVDLGTFNTSSAELTEAHTTLYIKWVNNPSIIDSNIPSFSEGDMSMTIMIKAEEGVLEAGEYTEEELKIKLTKGMKDGDTSKTKDLGSNKTVRSVTINDISEDHICGSFSMTTEDGLELISASFDMDVKVVKF